MCPAQSLSLSVSVIVRVLSCLLRLVSLCFCVFVPGPQICSSRVISLPPCIWRSYDKRSLRLHVFAFAFVAPAQSHCLLPRAAAAITCIVGIFKKVQNARNVSRAITHSMHCEINQLHMALMHHWVEPSLALMEMHKIPSPQKRVENSPGEQQPLHCTR